MGNYRIAHTMIRVIDLDRSIEFYQEALGFEEVKRRDEPNDEYTLVFLSDGKPNGHQLELTYNYRQDVPYDLGTAYGHLAVLVDDLEASWAAHKAKGYQPTQLKGLGSDGRPRYYFIADPDGYKIEIIRN